MGFLKKIALATIAVTLTLALGACAKEAAPENEAPVNEAGENTGEDANAPDDADDSVTPAETAEFTNGNDTFTIAVAGEFTQDTNVNPDQIVIDNADRTLTIMVQKLGKSNLQQMNEVEDLDQFITFYKEKGIAALVENSEVTPIDDFTATSALNAKADEFVASQGGQTSKAFIAYLETADNFYAYTITGVEELYDANVETLKESINTLTEK